MKFNAGDKVRFLNESLEGVVSGTSGRDTVLVMIEDGFEIPVSASQLVKVGQEKEETVAREQRAELPETRSTPVLPEGIYLVLEAAPGDELKAMLYNNSGSHILCNLLEERKNTYHSLFFSEMAKGAYVPVTMLRMSQFEKWPSLHLQALFRSEDGKELREPLVNTLKWKADTFRKSLMTLEGRSFYVFPLRPDDISRAKLEKLSGHDFSGRSLPEAEKDRSQAKRTQQETDLHIDKISADWSDLSAADIMSLQLMEASRSVDDAYAAGQEIVILIHGIGNGRLREELIRMLRKHPAVKGYKQADTGRYGGGALEVTLK